MLGVRSALRNLGSLMTTPGLDPTSLPHHLTQRASVEISVTGHNAGGGSFVSYSGQGERHGHHALGLVPGGGGKLVRSCSKELASTPPQASRAGS